MRHMKPIPTTTGFTLLELLIAIAVFSIISTIIYSGLKTVLDAEQHTDKHIEGLSKLQISLSLIQRDIEQAVTRPVRNEYGDTVETMIGSENSSVLLEFTRGGYLNPMQQSRSNLQRVGYQMEDDRLYRIRWNSLDRAPEETPKRSQLLDHVISIKLVFYDQQMRTSNEWPPTQLVAGGELPASLPRAIELTLEIEKIGKIRRLFRVAELAVGQT